MVAIEPQRENVFIQFLRKIRMKINPGYSSDQHFFTKNEMYEILDKLNVKSPQVEYTSYLTQPFAQVVMRPQFFFVPIVKFIVKLETYRKDIPNKFKNLVGVLMFIANFNKNRKVIYFFKFVVAVSFFYYF